MNLQHVLYLIRKDALIEWRQKHTLFGVLLYVGSTVFAVYMMLNGQSDPKVWNALFWLLQLFVSVNAVAKSFLQESQARYRYYFTLVAPGSFMAAKMIYNIVLQLLISLLTLGLFSLMLGNPLKQASLFIAVASIGSVALSGVFTFLSAIAAKANQNAALMAILGFPIITPVLMILSRLAVKTVMPVYQEGWGTLAGVMGGLILLIFVLSLILFPFLWKE
ncbi:MAG: heme exporter protein CcmB [Chitinophagaceae bacterium]|uniref:Heme exporter protein CcmB n=1 Tax=Rurimicrobium arvi TaxID=2049916 RepID=A0ABP8MUT1_9BACT